MIYTDILSECQMVAIYLGNTCNFNCSYCDRDYIETSIGSQGFRHSNIDHLINFFDQLYLESNLKVKKIAFHGGEPFLYVKRMDQILEALTPLLDREKLQVLITTNTSLVLENQWFLEKWAKYLTFTFSYDFIFQEDNRSQVDIDSVGQLCLDLKIPVMWQFVMPITDPRVFSLELAQDIIDKIKYSAERVINLIPLRHHRGKDKFKDFFDELNMYKFSEDFIRFINVLYNYNVRVRIDGAYKKVDKNYTGKHYKIILSPDGYIYPEYDFCEYQLSDFRVGQWYNSSMPGKFVPVLYDSKSDDNLIPPECKSCSVRADCGIKYLYKLFDYNPKGRCAFFYRIINQTVDYTTRLNTKDNFYTWVMPPEPQDYDKYIPVTTDYKAHFLKVDNLISAKKEIVFSILRRYNCFANCSICHVGELFEKDKTIFDRYIPAKISPELSDRWLETFTGYYVNTSSDDLYFLKTNHPKLFRWYQEHSSLFQYTATTDNAFVRTVDILLNDMHLPQGIQEITFSDKWLDKVNLKKLIPQLEQLNNKSKIEKIKIIKTEANSLQWQSINDFVHVLESNDIRLKVHDMTTNHNEVNYSVCGHCDYLQYDSFFMTTADAIDPTVVPYDVLDDNFTFSSHIAKHLNAKKEVYNRYINKLKVPVNKKDKKLLEYYKFVASNLTVNDNYNFIPDVAITPHDKLYWKLVNEGWTKTNLGLVNVGITQEVTPLYHFKKHE